jgi:DNA-binding CsgD family transcriptional regulator
MEKVRKKRFDYNYWCPNGTYRKNCTPAKVTVKKKLLLLYNDSISEVSSYISVQCLYFLCDSDGIILAENNMAAGDTPFKPGVIPGASLLEESVGTNSVSLCMTLNRPVNILPQHHYCDLLSECYEYCIPLDYNSETIGYIAVITTNQPIRPELIAITNLTNYKICNEYLKFEKQSILDKNAPERLNDKQIEILKHMAKGLTDYAISKEMKLSISSVKYHKHNIFQKYNATTGTQAIVKAIKFSNLSLDDIT